MTDQVKYTQKLPGAKILILGGTSGIGYALAEASLESGAHVTLSSSNPTRIASALSALKSSYPTAAQTLTAHPCDLSDPETLEDNLLALLRATGPGIDHIAFLAGNALDKTPLAEHSLESVRRAGTLRFFAYILLGKHAGAFMRRGAGSSVTFTTAGVSRRPMPGWVVEGAYMAGQGGICRGLALELAPVRVNLVLPGAVDTPFWTSSGLSDEKKKAFFDGVASRMPTGRVPGPEDVAEAYLYLMKDHNITGSCISTNGGWFLV